MPHSVRVDRLINEGQIDLVVNLPNNNTRHLKDNFLIRRMAIDHGVPLITNYQVSQWNGKWKNLCFLQNCFLLNAFLFDRWLSCLQKLFVMQVSSTPPASFTTGRKKDNQEVPVSKGRTIVTAVRNKSFSACPVSLQCSEMSPSLEPSSLFLIIWALLCSGGCSPTPISVKNKQKRKELLFNTTPKEHKNRHNDYLYITHKSWKEFVSVTCTTF